MALLNTSPVAVVGRINKPLNPTYQATSTGGTGAVTWSIMAGSLPAGLSLNAATGVISGTPTVTDYNVNTITLRATDGAAATSDFVVRIAIYPQVKPVRPSWAVIGTAYSGDHEEGASASEQVAFDYTYAVTAGALPPGLALNASTGAITGTPTTAGIYAFTVTATDQYGNTDTINDSLTMVDALILNNGGRAICPVTATFPAGVAPITWAVQSGTLDSGLTLNAATGVISGTTDNTPTNDLLIVRGTDATSATHDFYIRQITGNFSLPGGITNNAARVGVPYVGGPVVTFSPGTGIGSIEQLYKRENCSTNEFTWTLTAGALPPGLSLNAADGTISGIPTAAGTFNFTTTADDGLGNVNNWSNSTIVVTAAGSTIDMSTPSAANSNVINLARGAKTFLNLAATGQGPVYTWTYSFLPPAYVGLTAMSGGTGSTQIMYVEATDWDEDDYIVFARVTSNAVNHLRGFLIKTFQRLSIDTASVANGAVGSAYTQAIASSLGTPDATVWSTSNGIPPGLSINSATGVISGTPTTAGTYTFEVQALNGFGYTVKQYTMTVSGGLAINASPAPQTSVDTGIALTSFDFEAGPSRSGGTAPYTYSIVAGALPAGVTLTAAGVLSGTPTASGTFNFTVQVTDGTAATATRAYTLYVNDQITIATPAAPATVAPCQSQALQTGGIQTANLGGDAGSYTSTFGAGTVDSDQCLTATALGNMGWQRTDIPVGTNIDTDDIISLAAEKTLTAVDFAANVATFLTFQNSAFTKLTELFLFNDGSALAIRGYNNVLLGTLPAGTFAIGDVAKIETTGDGAGNWTTRVYKNAVQVFTSTYAVANAGIDVVSRPSTSTVPIGQTSCPPKQTVTYRRRLEQWTSAGATGAFGSSTADPTTWTGSAAGVAAITAVPNDDAINAQTNPATTVTTSTLAISGCPAGTVAASSVHALNTNADPAGTVSWTASGGTLSAASAAGGTSVNWTAPAAAGTYTVGATACGQTATSCSITVAGALALAAAPVPQACSDVGTAITSHDFDASNRSGGTAAYTYAVSAGAIPTGLSLSAAGVLSGTPTAAGTFNFTIQVTDGMASTATQNYSMTVNAAPALAAAPAPQTTGTQGAALTSFDFEASAVRSGGCGAITYAISAGALPAGVTLSAAGVLSGTPTANGVFNYTVQVTDALGVTATRAYTLTIAAGLSLSAAPAPQSCSDIGTAITSHDFDASNRSGGTAPYTYSVSAGAIPTGLTLSAAGVLSGTPTAAGAFNFTVQVVDGIAQTASQSFSMTVNAAVAMAPTPTPQSNADVGLAIVSFDFEASAVRSGGCSPYTYSISGGSLPPGLTLSAAGVLSGTPTTAGAYFYAVQVTDAAGAIASQAYSMTVAAAIALAAAPAPPTNGTVGLALVSHDFNPNRSGGSPPYTFSLSAGALPAGVTLSAAGILSGTPTASGVFNYTVQVADNLGQTASQAFTLTVAAALALSAAPAPQSCSDVGTAITAHDFDASNRSGGTAPHTYSVSAGAIPTGLALTAAGLLSGTPTAAGTFNFTIQVTDSLGATATQSYSMTVNTAPALAAAPAPQTTANVGLAITSFDFEASAVRSGGCLPVSYAISAGALPTGLALSVAGVLSGTPTATGTFNFTVQVTDSLGVTATRAYSITVAASLALAAAPVTSTGTVGLAIVSHDFDANNRSGGTAPYSYSLTAGALPAGVTLSAAGVLSGTPTAAGTFNYTVQVTDSLSSTATQAYTLTVAAAPALSSTPVPFSGVGVNGTALTAHDLDASNRTGGTGAFTYSISAGALPAGVTLSAAGVLSGTPTVTGTFNYTVQAVDSLGAGTTQNYSLTIYNPIQISTAAAANSGVNATYNQALTTINGDGGAQAWTVSAGTLPPGVSLNPTTGALTGTPTTAGTYNFDITVTDGTGSDTASYTITIAPVITVATAALPNGPQNVAYSQTISTNPGFGAVTFAVTAGALPTGLSLNAATGVISGTPTVAGVYNFDVTATDDTGSATQSYSVTITPAIAITTAVLPIGFTGSAYNQTPTTSGGSGAQTWSVSSGALPTGVTLNTTTGALTGTPTVSGTFNFILQVTDATGSDTQPYTLSIEPPISISPSAQTLGPGATYAPAFNPPGGTWTTTCGSINATTGEFTAPSTAGTCTATYTSLGGQTASIVYTTEAAVTGSGGQTLPSGGTGTTPTFSPAGGTWTADCGTVDPLTGVFTAPVVTGNSNLTCTATYTTPGGQTFDVVYVITPVPTITPNTRRVGSGARVSAPTVTPTGGTWTATCGSINATTGEYTAPINNTPALIYCTVTYTVNGQSVQMTYIIEPTQPTQPINAVRPTRCQQTV